MVVTHRDLLVLLDSTPLDAADGDAAHELAVIDGGDQHLEGSLHIGLRAGDILQNGVEQGLQVAACHIGLDRGGALPAGAEQHGGVQLLVGGVQIHQKLQHLVNDLIHPLVGAVDLVDHHNDPVAQLQGLGEHEAGLGHGALGGVHQQDDAVDHLQDALHLTAEIGVARSVHNIDLHIAVLDGGILGGDGDATLPLQIVGVHHAVHHGLVLPVHAGLLEHLIHQSGLAMIDVGDNGNVSQLLISHIQSSSYYLRQDRWGPGHLKQGTCLSFWQVWTQYYTAFGEKNQRFLKKTHTKLHLLPPGEFRQKGRVYPSTGVENYVDNVQNRKNVRLLLTNSNICCIIQVEHKFCFVRLKRDAGPESASPASPRGLEGHFMQTLYYSTSNWIRHTDNIVDLEQYRRKLSKAEDSQTEETSEQTLLPQSAAPRVRRSRQARRHALFLDACASMGILVMTLTFALRALVV